MNAIDAIPRDLREFLAAGGTLQYDADECDPGKVTLCTMEQLQLCLFSVDSDDTDVEDEDPHREDPGCYLVEGVDLIRDADGGYGSEGLLIWLPQDECYAAWDGGHNKMFVFDNSTTWSDIVQSPVPYLNAQWESYESALVSPIRPWIHHVYNPQQVFRRFAFPTEWFIAEQTLRGDMVDGVQMRIPREIKVEINRTEESLILNAARSHMDDDSKWIPEESVSRSLDAAQQTKLQAMIRKNFWDAGEPETDYGESRIIWQLEGFAEKRYRSITQFYSDNPKPDWVAELGESILELAGLQPLESFLA
jgi:hypothetical protein